VLSKFGRYDAILDVHELSRTDCRTSVRVSLWRAVCRCEDVSAAAGDDEGVEILCPLHEVKKMTFQAIFFTLKILDLAIRLVLFSHILHKHFYETYYC